MRNYIDIENARVGVGIGKYSHTFIHADLEDQTPEILKQLGRGIVMGNSLSYDIKIDEHKCICIFLRIAEAKISTAMYKYECPHCGHLDDNSGFCPRGHAVMHEVRQNECGHWLPCDYGLENCYVCGQKVIEEK